MNTMTAARATAHRRRRSAPRGASPTHRRGPRSRRGAEGSIQLALGAGAITAAGGGPAIRVAGIPLVVIGASGLAWGAVTLARGRIVVPRASIAGTLVGIVAVVVVFSPSTRRARASSPSAPPSSCSSLQGSRNARPSSSPESGCRVPPRASRCCWHRGGVGRRRGSSLRARSDRGRDAFSRPITGRTGSSTPVITDRRRQPMRGDAPGRRDRRARLDHEQSRVVVVAVRVERVGGAGHRLDGEAGAVTGLGRPPGSRPCGSAPRGTRHPTTSRRPAPAGRSAARSRSPSASRARARCSAWSISTAPIGRGVRKSKRSASSASTAAQADRDEPVGGHFEHLGGRQLEAPVVERPRTGHEVRVRTGAPRRRRRRSRWSPPPSASGRPASSA